jgi:hypothetical protein
MTMPDGPERFKKSCDYLKYEGILPRPIILERLSNLYHIFDGYHRITTFFYLFGFFDVSNKDTSCLNVQASQKAWVAEKISF